MATEKSEETEVHQFRRDANLDKDGIAQVTLQEYVKHQLPWLLQIKEEMDAGRRMTNGELELMDAILKDAEQASKLVHANPEYEEVVAKVLALLGDITTRGLQNEPGRD